MISSSTSHQTKCDQNLKYIILPRPNSSEAYNSFSLAPSDSDFFHNQTLLNPLIGTLVKYDQTGRISPYLASSFSVSENKRKWTFQLRENLTCEDGSPITSNVFVKQLEEQLLVYSKKGSVIGFDLLKGWDDFKKGNSSHLEGLYATPDNAVVFEFIHRPEDFLEFLRMVYFGFWCGGVERKTPDKFISSGAYKIEQIIDSKNIVLAKRNEWFSQDQCSPKKVELSIQPLEEALKSRSRTMILMGVGTASDSQHEDFIKIVGTPAILRFFVLSPFKEGPFKNQKNRLVFLNRIRKHTFQINSPTSFLTNSFYFTAKSDLNLAEMPDNYVGVKPGAKITVTGPSSVDDIEGNLHRQLIEYALAGSGIEIEFIEKPNVFTLDQIKSNEYIDIRIGTVDIGATPMNDVIKMMFCTKMGVSFPDPNARICQLVQRYEQSEMSPNNDYIKEFNQFLYEDAAVVPLYHKALSWLITKDIDPTQIPAVIVHPQFETIRFK